MNWVGGAALLGSMLALSLLLWLGLFRAIDRFGPNAVLLTLLFVSLALLIPTSPRNPKE